MKREELEDALERKQCREYDVDVVHRLVVIFRLPVILKNVVSK